MAMILVFVISLALLQFSSMAVGESLSQDGYDSASTLELTSGVSSTLILPTLSVSTGLRNNENQATSLNSVESISMSATTGPQTDTLSTVTDLSFSSSSPYNVVTSAHKTYIPIFPTSSPETVTEITLITVTLTTQITQDTLSCTPVTQTCTFPETTKIETVTATIQLSGSNAQSSILPDCKISTVTVLVPTNLPSCTPVAQTMFCSDTTNFMTETVTDTILLSELNAQSSKFPDSELSPASAQVTTTSPVDKVSTLTALHSPTVLSGGKMPTTVQITSNLASEETSIATETSTATIIKTTTLPNGEVSATIEISFTTIIHTTTLPGPGGEISIATVVQTSILPGSEVSAAAETSTATFVQTLILPGDEISVATIVQTSILPLAEPSVTTILQASILPNGQTVIGTIIQTSILPDSKTLLSTIETLVLPDGETTISTFQISAIQTSALRAGETILSAIRTLILPNGQTSTQVITLPSEQILTATIQVITLPDGETTTAAVEAMTLPNGQQSIVTIQASVLLNGETSTTTLSILPPSVSNIQSVTSSNGLPMPTPSIPISISSLLPMTPPSTLSPSNPTPTPISPTTTSKNKGEALKIGPFNQLMQILIVLLSFLVTF